ncbi:MAG TPA: hypothetical protein VGS01_09470 [Candidatus Limnocylindria bacterium]|nr:hypothetical protein [Candidatus Limnocylindria bacterium]
MFFAVVTSKGVAKITASRELADLAVEHLRKRVRFIASRADAERAIREALTLAEQDTRLRTVKLDSSHGPAEDPARREQRVIPRAGSVK